MDFTLFLPLLSWLTLKLCLFRFCELTVFEDTLCKYLILCSYLRMVNRSLFCATASQKEAATVMLFSVFSALLSTPSVFLSITLRLTPSPLGKLIFLHQHMTAFGFDEMRQQIRRARSYYDSIQSNKDCCTKNRP